MKHFLRNALQIEQYGFDLLKILFLMKCYHCGHMHTLLFTSQKNLYTTCLRFLNFSHKVFMGYGNEP